MCLYEFLMLVESLFHGNQAMIRKLAGFFSKTNRFSYNFLTIQDKNKDMTIYYETNTSWEELFNIKRKNENNSFHKAIRNHNSFHSWNIV